ncbi:MAG: hypothetical protein GW911_05485 [Armatimonadetes bacterium]|nr:hypothetical protein [Armatimonadota bacterium]
MAPSTELSTAASCLPRTVATVRHIEVARVPTVVQPEEVREVCEAVSRGGDPPPEVAARVADLVSGYYLADAGAESALGRLLERLFRTDHGTAMLINGVYGSGKTHLLALLALLCQSVDALRAFRAGHPALAEVLPDRCPAHATVYVSLESYSGTQHDLEQILWAETAQQLADRGSPWQRPGSADRPASRDELLRSLLNHLATQGHSGCVWLVDELSLFLGAKSAAQLQNEAAFLQFLAHRAARHPLYLIASVQRSLEHLGDLDTHSLRQLSDRFEPPLTLSLTHVRRLLQERLIHRRDPEAFARSVREQAAAVRDRFPRLDWDWEKLAESYPFHPATVDCLERVTARFFSRTRSAVGFLQEAARRFVEAHAEETHPADLITPDRLFDHFRQDLEANPELREYVTEVWRHYESTVPEIAPTDSEYALRLVKLLAVLKIGARYPTVTEATNALLFDSGLPGNGSYGYTQAVLEALRTQGDYVTIRRHGALFADQYTLDVGARLGAALRRRLANTTHLFSAADSRLSPSAFAACEGADWPLARVVEGSPFLAAWQHERRSVHCRLVTAADLSRDLVANEVALLRNPATTEDLHVLLADPLAAEDQATLFRQAGGALPPDRWNAAYVLWCPRKLEPHERKTLAEHAAARLLEKDPALRDNPRGEKLLELLREELPGLAAEVRPLLRSLYGAGFLLDANGRESQVSRDPAELPEWSSVLARVLARQLPLVFPQRLELPLALTSGLADASASLTEYRLRGDSPPVPDRLTAFAQCVEAHEPALCAAILAEVPDGDFLREPQPGHYVSFDALRARLRKSVLGLPDVLLEPVAARLLASGELQALDGELNAVSAGSLTAPLADSVYGICRGQLVSAEQWRVVAALGDAVLEEPVPESASFGAQQLLWRKLLQWKEQQVSATERAKARLAQLRKALGHSPADWRSTSSLAEQFGTLLLAIQDAAPARQGLARLAETLPREVLRASPARASAQPESLRNLLQGWERCAGFLNNLGNEVLLANAYLAEVGSALPPGDLCEQRQGLLDMLKEGEALVSRAGEFEGAWRQWHSQYAAAYETWHASTYSADRFRPYAELRRGSALAALQQLARLGIPLPCSANDLLAAVGTEFGKCCDRPGLAASLRAFPHCAHCGLRLNERLQLAPADKLGAQVAAAFRRNAAAVLTADRRAHWQQLATTGTSAAHRRLTALCSLQPDTATPEEVLAQLTDEVVQLLLFSPAQASSRRRRLRDLRTALSGKTLTLSQAKEASGRWLNPGGLLAETDELTFED